MRDDIRLWTRRRREIVRQLDKWEAKHSDYYLAAHEAYDKIGSLWTILDLHDKGKPKEVA